MQQSSGTGHVAVYSVYTCIKIQQNKYIIYTAGIKLQETVKQSLKGITTRHHCTTCQNKIIRKIYLLLKLDV